MSPLWRVALAAFLLCAAAGARAEPPASRTLAPAGSGTPALVWRDRAGVARGPADLGGRLVLAHFWATWCGVCRSELPALDRLQQEMGDEGLRIAAVALDRLGWPVVDRLTTSLSVERLTVFHDLNRDAAQAAGVVGLPTTLVLDGAGREVARLKGAGDWDDPGLRAQLRALMSR